MKTRTLAVALAATTLVLAACGSSASTTATTTAHTTAAPTTAPAAAAGDIVAVAAGNPDFSTLVAAVKAAGLVETLQGAGPFTVFAPTNEAFAKLPAGLVDKLLLPENKDTLVKILTYHVVAGKVMAADVKPGDVKSVEGSPITIAIDGSTVTLNKSTKVTATDVAASNGVIHVIDSVLVPADVDVSKL
jgi:uncharacterized surface protein with fasciclin (FAS1) repeats